MKSSYGILLVVEGKILMCRWRKSTKWGFPKGGLEQHETPGDAAIRECYEEIGIRLDRTRLGEKLGPIIYSIKKSIKSVWVFEYFMKTSELTIRDNKLISNLEEGINDARFFTPQEALEHINYRQKPLLLQYIVNNNITI
jgi:8-oxo-dGTP pyrophosphatase MutT (NUDIX family)